MRRKQCTVCGRRDGSTKDRCGEEDGVPLGPIEQCPTCRRNACPDCMHEANCCFLKHNGEDSPPRGWRLEKIDQRTGAKTFVRN